MRGYVTLLHLYVRSDVLGVVDSLIKDYVDILIVIQKACKSTRKILHLNSKLKFFLFLETL